MPAFPASRQRTNVRVLAAQIRELLPVGVYVSLLHDAATRGRMPILDRHGDPTGEFTPIEVRERIDLLKYLVNKVMPDKQEIETITRTPESLAEISRMTDEELMRLVDARAAEAEVVETQDAATERGDSPPAGEARVGASPVLGFPETPV